MYILNKGYHTCIKLSASLFNISWFKHAAIKSTKKQKISNNIVAIGEKKNAERTFL